MGEGPETSRSETSRSAGRLRASAVLVEGLGPCGARIVEHLCMLGVGTVLLRDGRTVGTAEMGGVYRTVHHGQDRVAAVRSALRRSPELPALLGCPPEARTAGVDLHVLCTGTEAWEALRGAERESGAVLPVELSASGSRIGPLISPGRTLCAECLRHHTRNRRHGTSAEGAGHRPGDALPSASASQLEPTIGLPAGPTRLLLEQTAASAAQQVRLLLTDHRQAAARGAELVFDGRTGGLAQRPAEIDPECPCLTLVA